MPRAYNATRKDHHYRHEVFSAGLRAAGFDVVPDPIKDVRPGDLYLSWNRYLAGHHAATEFERAGGLVMIAENGFVNGRLQGGDYYSLALDSHNGMGRWPVGGGLRWDALGVELKPWRARGNHILIAPNRNFGQPGLAMPADWQHSVKERLRALTTRPILVREHPGNQAPRRPLEDDFREAWATVIWASSVGVHSLIAGVPVICESPFWVCKPATGALEQIENPPMPDRLPAMHRLAWHQWSLDEIQSGEPFRELLAIA